MSITGFAQEGKWKKVQKLNTLEQYQKFLSKYPDSEFFGQAKQKIIEIEFNNTNASNTISGYKIFIDTYPENNKYLEEAKKSLLELEFENAKNLNTVEAYTNFIDTYPENNKYLEEAKKSLLEREFEKAKNLNTVEAYTNFIDTYKGSKYTNDAETLLKKVELEEVIASLSTLKDINKFIIENPGHKFETEIENHKKDFIFNYLKEENTLAAYSNHLKLFEGTDRYETVKKAFLQQLSKELNDTLSFELLQLASKHFPDEAIYKKSLTNYETTLYDEAKAEIHFNFGGLLNAQNNYLQLYPEGKYSMTVKAQQTKYKNLKNTLIENKKVILISTQLNVIKGSGSGFGQGMGRLEQTIAMITLLSDFFRLTNKLRYFSNTNNGYYLCFVNNDHFDFIRNETPNNALWLIVDYTYRIYPGNNEKKTSITFRTPGAETNWTDTTIKENIDELPALKVNNRSGKIDDKYFKISYLSNNLEITEEKALNLSRVKGFDDVPYDNSLLSKADELLRNEKYTELDALIPKLKYPISKASVNFMIAKELYVKNKPEYSQYLNNLIIQSALINNKVNIYTSVYMLVMWHLMNDMNSEAYKFVNEVKTKLNENPDISADSKESLNKIFKQLEELIYEN